MITWGYDHLYDIIEKRNFLLNSTLVDDNLINKLVLSRAQIWSRLEIAVTLS